MPLLSETDIAAHLATLPGWRRVGAAIEREFVFPGFPEAVAFVARLVPPAEAANHHPDIAIHYRRVVVQFTTHDAGGITGKDVEGARETERIAEG
jgi:4a-hydroxytetrahydrobiopterin dehydratase